MPDAGIHTKGEVDLPNLLGEFKQKLDKKSGAIGCFIGVVREVSEDGGAVKTLHYESSDDAVRNLEEIAAAAEKREGISRVAIHHIVDDLGPGEDAVYVLVAGEHRAEVFETLPWIMDRVKSEVQIWKKEIAETGEHWVHETK